MDKTETKSLGIKFTSKPNTTMEGDVVKNEKCRLYITSNPSSTEENFIGRNIVCIKNIPGNEAGSRSEVLEIAKKPSTAEDSLNCKQNNQIDAEKAEADFMQKDTLKDLSQEIAINQKIGKQVKLSDKPCETTQENIKDKNCELRITSSPSSSEEKFLDCNYECSENSLDSLPHNEARLRFEFHNLARNCLAFMLGFCIGLIYGLFSSYTNASIADLYVSTYFVVYLVLYLMFF